MTLATRCSACGTSFRVVQDQLKVSGGWVRCGRCNEVFNALDALYEIDTQAGSAGSAVDAARQAVQAAHAPQDSAAPSPTGSPGWSAPATPSSSSTALAADASSAARSAVQGSVPTSAAASATAGAHSHLDAASRSPAPSASAPGSAFSARFAAPSAPVGGWTQGLESSPRAGPASSSAFGFLNASARNPHAAGHDSRLAPSVGSEPVAADAAASVPGVRLNGGADGLATAPESTTQLYPSPPLPASVPADFDDRPVQGFEDVETRLEPRPGEEAGESPSFMRPLPSPRPAASTSRRRLLGVAATLLMGVLLIQLALAWRDALAAQFPASLPLLAAACEPIGCRIEAPRRMAALAVEGSHLRQLGTQEGYELMVALRNRSESTVLLPAVELTLTDSQGQALIRRVILPQEWHSGPAHLGGSAELSLVAALRVAEPRVAGYTVEIFYP